MDLSDISSCYKSYIDTEKPHRSMVDRYFTRRFKIDVKRKPSEDLCILEHSNRICIITLAPSHPIIASKKQIVKVDYQADINTSRLDNKVSGKLKRGAQSINEGSPLCHITCEDGSLFTVYGCIHAGLVEVNERLVSNPQLLVDKPDADGYIAILLTKKNDHPREMARLLTAEQYSRAVNNRKTSLTAAVAEPNTETVNKSVTETVNDRKLCDQLTDGQEQRATDDV